MTTSLSRSTPSTSPGRSPARSASAASALPVLLLALAVALPTPALAQAPSEYVVQPGDTCASIARKLLGSEKAYEQIHRLNQMGPPPHSLKPGTRLKIRDDSPDARLTFVKPDVNARKAGAPQWTPANNGEPLFRLDEVNTLRRAGAEVTFRDETSLQLRENALIVIYGQSAPTGPAPAQKSGAVQLVQGELRLRLAQLRGDAVGVDTPAAKISASSQDLHVGVDAAKMSRVAVYQGNAEVAAQGAKVAVAEGQGTRVEKGKAPEKPRPLPRAPGWTVPDTLMKLAHAGKSTAVDLAWKPVPNAAKYRVEVSRDEKFNGLVVDETVPADAVVLRLTTPDLEPGRAYARVQAVDADGLVGQPSAVKVIEVALVKLEHGDREADGGLEDEREVRFSIESPSKLDITVDDKPVSSPVVVNEPGRHEVKVSAPGVTEPAEFEVEVKPPPPPEPAPAPPAPEPAPKTEAPPPPADAPKAVTLGSLMGTPVTRLERPPLPGALPTGEGLAELRLQPQWDNDQAVRLRLGGTYSQGMGEHTVVSMAFQGRAPLAGGTRSPDEQATSIGIGARFTAIDPDKRLSAGLAVEGITGQTHPREPTELMVRSTLVVGYRGEHFALATSHGLALLFVSDTRSIESAYQAFYLPYPGIAVGVEAHSITPLALGGQTAWGGAVGTRMRFGQLELGASVRSGLLSPRDQQAWGAVGALLTLGWHL